MSYDNGMSEAAKEAAKTTSAELIEIDALGKNPQFAKSGFEPSGRLWISLSLMIKQEEAYCIPPFVKV